MAKAKKERTPEQIQAAKDRMAKARAARQNKNPETKSAEEILSIQDEAVDESDMVMDTVLEAEAAGDLNPEPVAPTTQQPDTIVQPDVGDLVRQIQELKAYMFDNMQRPAPTAEQSSVRNGQLTGTIDKYSMDPNMYPDPRTRLEQEPKLARFAFTMNYELDWEIGESAYETIDHIRQREPKFTLTLIKIMIDEDTGEPTNGRYDICRLIMHEDPAAALIIAREQGLEVDEMDEPTFLNEMRYLRMRDWLIDSFYPPKPQPQKQKRDMVVNGKLVSYWEKNADANSGEGGIKKLDWDNLPKVKF